ncbi:DUF6701 domain-containing protein [Shewanella acanthi]|uniref:DUF6701 domain-containing protein n=1 Tax=Shewanella acanthi TaxID=2864212 RepID=UPI0021ABE4CF|nr:DUF6701 domain-containing protein [Shewanella acanthi]
MALRIVSFLLAGLLVLPVYAVSIQPFDLNVFFPKVAQGHHDNNNDNCHKITAPQLEIYGDGIINGTGGQALNYCSTNSGSLSTSSCDDGSGGKRRCTITGFDLRGYDEPNFLNSSKAGGSITTCIPSVIGADGKNQFDTLELYITCTLSMSPTQTEYRFSKINIGSGVTLVLTAGDYWVDSFTLNSGGNIVLLGNVRIFTKQTALFNGGKLNEALTNNALIVAYGNVELDSGALLNGYVYSNERISINNGSTINGRVTSRYLFISSGSVNDQQPAAPLLDHFEIDYSSSPLTCKAESMQLRACTDANCSSLYTDTFSANLSPNPVTNGGWYLPGTTTSTSTVTFVNGTASVDLRHNVVTPITVNVSSASPAATSATLCRSGSGALSTAACTLAFAESGFIFDVPDKRANKSTTVSVSAVRKSDSTLECVPAFADATKNVGFWSSYISPSSIPSAWQQSLTVRDATGTATGTRIGKDIAARTLIPLKFTNGVASIEVNYPDAGKVQLDARYDGTAEDAGLVMTGSDQFVSVPAGLCVKPSDITAYCLSADMSCKVFRQAGQLFDMTVQAVAWQSDTDNDFCTGNLITPNFIDTNVTLASHVIAPTTANGGVDGVLGRTSYSHASASDNLNTITNQSISEVGVFQISALASANYLGAPSSLDIPLSYSANIGRFVPASFGLTDAAITPACSSVFSYMDQPFPVMMTLSALNLFGNVTQNYFGDFALGTAVLVAENNDNGVELSSRLSALSMTNDSWVKGIADIDTTVTFSRVAPVAATTLFKDGPFEALDIGVQLADNDPLPNGINSTINSPDMDAATAGACSSCNAKRISTQKLRHGRVVMDNTYGPETELLTMPSRAEYWNGSIWTLSSDDSCTIADYPLGSQVDNALLGYAFDPDLITGQSVSRAVGAGVTRYIGGELTLLWRTNATSGTLYRGQVTAPLDVPEWLEWYWNWTGTEPIQLFDPRASAFFGRYRGHDRIIYWREVN